MQTEFKRLATALCLTLVLAACGGGGHDGMVGTLPVADNSGDGGGGVTPPPAETPALRGTAAVGAPIAGGTVTVQCVSGTQMSATTGADGTWSTQTSGQVFPCILTLRGGNLDSTKYPQGLHSMAQDTGNVNVTPLTDLIVAIALGANPSAWLAAQGPGLGAALTAAAAKLPEAKATLSANLAASGYAVVGGDPFTMSFSPAAGDPYDDLLEAVTAALTNGGLTYADLLDSAAQGDTAAVLPGAGDLPAAAIADMPQMNAASLALVDGAVTMKTLTQAGHAVGAFVGGGKGNKAVLQLPGLHGMKLSELRSIEFETQFVGGKTNLGPYLSVLVDLRCNLAAPATGASLSEVRAQRRMLGFSPAVGGLYTDTFLASAGFAAFKVTPATPGWYSTGASNLPSLNMVSNNSTDVGTLDTFDFATYPDACIVDGTSGDGGLARDTSIDACNTAAALGDAAPAACALPHAGLLATVSDSASTDGREWQIKNVKVNGRKFSFK